MSDDVTLTSNDLSLPGERPPPRPVPALVIVWSLEEPHRVGEVAHFPARRAPKVLGRGGDAPERVSFTRQRPGLNTTTGPLMARRISRNQLTIHATGAKGLAVANTGRCELLHNGLSAHRETAVQVAPGDTLELENQLLLICLTRPTVLPDAAGEAASAPARFGGPDPLGLVGESPAAWALRERVGFVAGRQAHALVLGPSGAGKELLARALHALSPRGGGPWVSRSAATFPEGLIDAELFGNAKNFPNPGMAERPGLVGQASGGTLFLDELGELPEALQARLLRVMDAGEYQRLGESRTRRADLRLVAATNRSPESLKHDLLARLKLRITAPGLNERREDIPLLAAHLLRRIASDDAEVASRFFPGGDPTSWPRLAPALVRALISHQYTAHVRELEGLLWTAMGGSRGEWITLVEELVEVTRGASADPAELTPEAIQAALDRNEGRQADTYRELGLNSRHQLARLIKKYGLTVSRES